MGLIAALAVLLIAAAPMPSKPIEGAHNQGAHHKGSASERHKQSTPAAYIDLGLSRAWQPVIQPIPQQVTYYLHNSTKGDEEPSGFPWLPADGWVAIFTGLLFIVSAWQGWLILGAERRNKAIFENTRRQTIAAIAAAKAARISAEASKIQARALFALEISVVTLYRISFITQSKVAPGTPTTLDFSRCDGPVFSQAIINFSVVGRTDIIVIETSFNTIVAKDVPAEPSYSNVVHSPRRIAAGQSKEQFPSPFAQPFVSGGATISEVECAAIKAGEMDLWVYGYFAYKDILEDITEVGFIGSWSASRSIRETLGGPDAYQYQRKRPKV